VLQAHRAVDAHQVVESLGDQGRGYLEYEVRVTRIPGVHEGTCRAYVVGALQHRSRRPGHSRYLDEELDEGIAVHGMIDVDVEFEQGEGGVLGSVDDPQLRPGGMPAPTDEQGPFAGERVEVRTLGVGAVGIVGAP